MITHENKLIYSIKIIIGKGLATRIVLTRNLPVFCLLENLGLLYPRHLCRQVYSFRLSVRMFVSSLVLPSRSWNLRQSFV